MLLFLAFTTLVLASPLQKRAVIGPVIQEDFPDPAILKANGVYHAYATSGNRVNIQYATSSDGSAWTRQAGHDALPNPGDWVDKPAGIWAPDVISTPSGFIMYYAGESLFDKTRCIGAATSSSPDGPFQPQRIPLICENNVGGVIDPAGFQDTDGIRYVVYKVDGNRIGSNSTPLKIIKLNADGTSVDQSFVPITLLDRGEADGPLVEAPNIILRNGIYHLFFSSNVFNTPAYDISYATSNSIFGPYTKSSTPLLVSGNFGLTGPGGADTLDEEDLMVFHGITSTEPLRRPMYVSRPVFQGGKVVA